MFDIIIPAFNCSSTLGRALASLETQIFKDFRVIIVDDCSTEDITPIIQEKQKNLEIAYIRKETNEGPGLARQTGIDNASSNYVAFLDADDVLMPYTVETWYYMVSANSNIDVFHSYFYEQSYSDGTPVLLLHQRGFTWMHGKLYKLSFLKNNNIRFHKDLRYMEDSYFNSICTELGLSAIISIPMYIWINNQTSITRIDNGDFHKDKLSNFIHGIYLSTMFLEEHGVTNINHIKNTMEYIESEIANGQTLSDSAKEELNYITTYI